LGLLLTSFGSSYYHLAPDNARLVWDRLPMTLVFMPLAAAMIAERISRKAGLWLLPVLTAFGAGSVWQWYASESRGAGDLRMYAAVQAYALLVLLLALLLPARYTRSADLGWVAGFYLLGKVLETADRQVFLLTGRTVSGHTLKHLAAAAAGYWMLRHSPGGWEARKRLGPLGAKEFPADDQPADAEEHQTRRFGSRDRTRQVAVGCEDGDARRGSVHKGHAGGGKVGLYARHFLRRVKVAGTR